MYFFVAATAEDMKALTAAEAQTVKAGMIERAEMLDDQMEAMLLSAFEEVRKILP